MRANNPHSLVSFFHTRVRCLSAGWHAPVSSVQRHATPNCPGPRPRTDRSSTATKARGRVAGCASPLPAVLWFSAAANPRPRWARAFFRFVHEEATDATEYPQEDRGRPHLLPAAGVTG